MSMYDWDETVDLHDYDDEPDLICSYTRAQALADGTLVDVTEDAKEAGFRIPVAVTAGVWAEINAIPENSGEDVRGRLWDVLSVARMFAKAQPDESEFCFSVIMNRVVDGHRVKRLPLWTIVGPGDNCEPVLTIMLIGED